MTGTTDEEAAQASLTISGPVRGDGVSEIGLSRAREAVPASVGNGRERQDGTASWEVGGTTVGAAVGGAGRAARCSSVSVLCAPSQLIVDTGDDVVGALGTTGEGDVHAVARRGGICDGDLLADVMDGLKGKTPASRGRQLDGEGEGEREVPRTKSVLDVVVNSIFDDAGKLPFEVRAPTRRGETAPCHVDMRRAHR